MRIGDWSSDVCSSDLRFCVHAKRRWGKAMRLGSKAKLTIAVGLTAASAFLALGVRELRNASAATVQGEAAPVRVAAPVLPVRAARDRQSVVQGTVVYGSVGIGGARHIK